MPKTVDPYPSSELRVAIYDYFRWLSAKKPPAGPKNDDTGSEDSTQPLGQKVLAALMEEFPDELEGRATEVPIPRSPELSLRYNAYDDHMKRLVLLQTRLAAFERQGTSSSTAAAAASVPNRRKRKDPSSTAATDECDVKQLKPSPDDSIPTAAGSIVFKKVEKPPTWEERYDQLVEFEKGHGHCRVPKAWKENPALARWVARQRERFKHGTMKEDEMAKLQELDFDFVVKDKPTVPWEEWYEQLKLFKREHGHTRVPRTSATHKALGSWVHVQRGAYRRKDACMMETDRLTRLQEIGFEFKTGIRKGKNSWDDRFAQLVEFRRTHGHIRVPTDEKDDGFGTWFKRQVGAYWKFKSGNKSTLTHPQFKKLDDMGFGKDTAASK